ncbi:MAG: MFS transporter, partial [Planctomycetaceae bacterium]
ERSGLGMLHTLRVTLANPALWLLALSLGMLNACRYGFVDWGVSHLVAIERSETQRADIEDALRTTQSPEARRRLEGLLGIDLADDEAQTQVESAIADGLLPPPRKGSVREAVLMSALNYAVLPIGAVIGSFLAGWATDRFFGGRRAPVICGLLLILGILTLAYDPVARASFAATVVLLIGVGFCVYGPQVLLVGTAPADLARDGTAAAAAGFVNCFGYFGAAAAGDLLTGYLAENHGWSIAIYAWAGWAFAAAITVAFLWNATGRSSHERRVGRTS